MSSATPLPPPAGPTKNDSWSLPLLFSFVAGISTSLGGLAVLMIKKVTPGILSFSLSMAAAVMLTVSVLSLMPVFGLSTEKSSNARSEIFAFGVGSFLYFLLSKFAFPDPHAIMGLDEDAGGSSEAVSVRGDQSSKESALASQVAAGTASSHDRTDGGSPQDGVVVPRMRSPRAGGNVVFQAVGGGSGGGGSGGEIIGTRSGAATGAAASDGSQSPPGDNGDLDNEDVQKRTLLDRKKKNSPHIVQMDDLTSAAETPRDHSSSSRPYTTSDPSGGSSQNLPLRAVGSPNSHTCSNAPVAPAPLYSKKQQAKYWRIATLMFVSLVIHNFPEGMAVAVTTHEKTSTGLAVMLAIAFHNIPEGIVIAVPCLAARPESPWLGVGLATLSGLAEPLGALVSLAFLQHSTFLSADPGISLSFVAGMMCMVALWDLIPEARNQNAHRQGLVGFVVGTVLMVGTEKLLGEI